MARILIAEDDCRVSSFLERGLRASGFSTVVADDGERAQALGRTDDFDLLILDLGLPEKEGLCVLQELRSRGKMLPVLVLTGRRDRDAATCLNQGADDYMTNLAADTPARSAYGLDGQPEARQEPATPTARRPVNGDDPHAGWRTAFAVVLLTDIVDSTAREVAVGDRAWRELRDRHDRAAHESITRRGGHIIRHTGTGPLATLSEPWAALESAVDFVAEMAEGDLPVRAGMHAGVIETLDDGDVSGVTVNIAAQVHARAEPNEILVSRTVRDLLFGSQLTFVDRGELQLKGLDGAWRIYAVAP